MSVIFAYPSEFMGHCAILTQITQQQEKKPFDERDLPWQQGRATGYDEADAGGLLASDVYGYQA
ncbi:hypothetical protein [Comamonas sp. 4034]|uniref:hypothetical protein n=1 Tax=Comamonas sp. 4034 TaxID=3156455 RepID=UPI003D243E8D